MGKRNYLRLQGLGWDAVSMCVGLYERKKGRKSQVFQKQEGGTRFEKKTDSAEVKGAQVADEFVSFPREFS